MRKISQQLSRRVGLDLCWGPVPGDAAITVRRIDRKATKSSAHGSRYRPANHPDPIPGEEIGYDQAKQFACRLGKIYRERSFRFYDSVERALGLGEAVSDHTVAEDRDLSGGLQKV
jgi:hypothetical protein